MQKKHIAEPHINHERWMVSFADFMTLLFALFVTLYAMSQADPIKIIKVTESIQEAFGVIPGAGNSLLKNDPGGPGQVNLIPINLPRNPQIVPLEQKLKEAIKKDAGLKKGVQLDYEERGLVIRLQDSLLFDSGSDQIRPEAYPSLRKILKEVETYAVEKSQPIRIEGHTDNIAINTFRFPSNWELSTARASSVLRFVRQSTRIHPNMLSLAGYGEYKSIARNSTPEGRARNRRVDIVIINKSEAANEPTEKSGDEPNASPNTQLNQQLNHGGNH